MNDNYDEIDHRLDLVSQKAAEQIQQTVNSPHRPGADARVRQSEENWNIVREECSRRPIAYDATGATIYGNTPEPKKPETKDEEKTLLPIVTRGDNVPDKPINFLWKDRFPCQFGLVGGRQGLGKSMFVAYMAAKITNASFKSWGDGAPCPTGCVMFFKPEGGSSATVQRVRNMNGNVSNLVFYSGIGSGRLRPDGAIDTDFDPVVSDTANLTRAIDAAEKQTGQKVHLIVIDPITDFMGDNVRDSNNAEVTRALRELDYLAVEKNICIIGVKHLTKNQNSTAAVYSVGGSSAFTSKPRFVYLLDQTPDSRKAELEGDTSIERRLLLVPAKSNDFSIRNSIEFMLAGEDDNFRVEITDLYGEWTGDSLQWELSQINGATSKGRGRPADDERNAEVESLLEGGMSVMDVLEEMARRRQPVGKTLVYKIQGKLNEIRAKSYSDLADVEGEANYRRS